jgi:glycosyltransferase involved in cell wall biosynthesis
VRHRRRGYTGTLPAMADATSTLVVTPAHDEEETVGLVVEGVRALGLPSLVVDDGSADRTALVAAAAGAVVLRLPVNLGVGAALRTGFRYATRHGFKRVVQVDGDLQHPPEAIPVLIEAADRGADLVIGSRMASGYDAGARRHAMRLLSRVVSRSVGALVTDPTSGFKVVSEPLLTEFARSYPAEYLGDTVEALLHAAAFGASIVEVEVPMQQRAAGEATTTSHAAAHFARVLLAVIAGKTQR